MKKRLPRIITISISLFTIILVLLNQTVITSHYFFGLLYFSIPLLIFVNILLLLLYSIKRKLILLFPLLAILCSYNAIRQTYNISSPSKEEKGVLKVTTYNVGSFNFYWQDRDAKDRSGKSIDWMTNNLEGDVLCLQEFYNDRKQVMEDGVKKMKSKGYKYLRQNPATITTKAFEFGQVTFSKYPIIKSGPVKVSGQELPRTLYTDIVMKKDTIRVINIHMKSMFIRIYRNRAYGWDGLLYINTIGILKKLKAGISQRNKDIELVGEFVKKSPHKVILCGDFNDTPYSYTYQYMRKVLDNSYEEAGSGFGFTYNSFPPVIRIDNQFHDSNIKVVNYKTIDNKKHSDHYPVECWYQLNPDQE